MRNFIQEIALKKYNAMMIAQHLFDVQHADYMKSALEYCDGKLAISDISLIANKLRSENERSSATALIADVLDPEVEYKFAVEGIANLYARDKATRVFFKEYPNAIELTGQSPVYDAAYDKAKTEFLKSLRSFRCTSA